MTTAPDPQWVRCSSLGYYAACLYRAAWDRAIFEGEAEDTPESAERKGGDKPYADLGTCEHWIMQDRMGCIWPDNTPSIDHKYTPEQYACALRLFNNNEDRMDQAMDRAVALAIKHMPPTPDGLPWLAEIHVKDASLSGHVDFLSQDWTTMVDLKTTTRQPHQRRVKPANMWQFVGYKLKIPTLRWVYPLYVSSKGEWILPPEPFDFESPMGQMVVDCARDLLDTLNGPDLFDLAYPSLTGCADNFCPYIVDCHDQLLTQMNPVVKAPKFIASAGFNLEDYR